MKEVDKLRIRDTIATVTETRHKRKPCTFPRAALIEARVKLMLSQAEAGALIDCGGSMICHLELGIGGSSAAGRKSLRAYAEGLREYARAHGYQTDEFEPHYLCPGEFPVPEMVSE